MTLLTRWCAELAAILITAFAWAITGVRANWIGCLPETQPRIYYANHASHGDFVLIWSVLPRALRKLARPVAGNDYWSHGALRRFIGLQVFRAVLIERTKVTRESDPIGRMTEVLDGGGSLILFPEGTRNTTDAKLLPFKPGLHHLVRARPMIELVPVWIENLNRVMPKGEFLPIPLLCTVTFGTPLVIGAHEPRQDFITRARDALLALAPKDRLA